MIAEFIKMGKVEFAVSLFFTRKTSKNIIFDIKFNNFRCPERKSTMSEARDSLLTLISTRNEWKVAL